MGAENEPPVPTDQASVSSIDNEEAYVPIYPQKSNFVPRVSTSQAIFRAPLSIRTYIAVFYMGIVQNHVNIASAITCATLFFFGVALTPLCFLGVPILWLALWLARAVSKYNIFMLSQLLPGGELSNIDMVPSGGFWRMFTDPKSWRALGNICVTMLIFGTVASWLVYWTLETGVLMMSKLVGVIFSLIVGVEEPISQAWSTVILTPLGALVIWTSLMTAPGVVGVLRYLSAQTLDLGESKRKVSDIFFSAYPENAMSQRSSPLLPLHLQEKRSLTVSPCEKTWVGCCNVSMVFCCIFVIIMIVMQGMIMEAHCNSSSTLVENEWSLSLSDFTSISPQTEKALGIRLEVPFSQVRLVERQNQTNDLRFSLKLSASGTRSSIGSVYSTGFGPTMMEGTVTKTPPFTGPYVQMKSRTWFTQLKEWLMCPRAELTVSFPAGMMANGTLSGTTIVILIQGGTINMTGLPHLRKIQALQIRSTHDADVALGKMSDVGKIDVVTRGHIQVAQSLEADSIHLISKSRHIKHRHDVVLNASVITVKAKYEVIMGTVLARKVIDYNDDEIYDAQRTHVDIESAKRDIFVEKLLYEGGAGNTRVKAHRARVNLKEMDLKGVKPTDLALIQVAGHEGVNINLVRSFKGTVQAVANGPYGNVDVTVEHKFGRHVTVLTNSTTDFAAQIYSSGNQNPSPSLLVTSKHGGVRINGI